MTATTADPGSRWDALRLVLRNRNLRRLELAHAGSTLGDWAYATAIAIWAYGVGGAQLVGVWAAVRLLLVAVFLVVTTLLGGAAVPGWVPWWNFLLPVGLIVAFLAVARFSVKAMRKDLAARAALIRAGESVDEETVALKAELVASEETGSVQLGAPVEMTATLWDPIPVSAQTYVSKPLAPRTVRTIDLSSPASPAHAVPVTADAPASESAAVDAEQSPRAVGE